MIGQGFFELLWRARWIGAAVALHMLILGPVLLIRYGPPAASELANTTPIEIVEIAIATPPPQPPAETAPKPEARTEPGAQRSPAQPKRPKPSVVTIPTVSKAPPSAPTAVIDRPASDALSVPLSGTKPRQELPSLGGGAVGNAEQLTLRSIFCRDMTEWQRQDAGCDTLEASRQQYAPLYEATPLKDYERIQRQQIAAMRATVGETYVEGFLKRNSGVPVSFGQVGGDSVYQSNNPSGIDNTIFMERRPAGQGALDRIDQGQKPDWEDDIRRAHGTD